MYPGKLIRTPENLTAVLTRLFKFLAEKTIFCIHVQKTTEKNITYTYINANTSIFETQLSLTVTLQYLAGRFLFTNL